MKEVLIIRNGKDGRVENIKNDVKLENPGDSALLETWRGNWGGPGLLVSWGSGDVELNFTWIVRGTKLQPHLTVTPSHVKTTE